MMAEAGSVRDERGGRTLGRKKAQGGGHNGVLAAAYIVVPQSRMPP